jgi:hypothetical protein
MTSGPDKPWLAPETLRAVHQPEHGRRWRRLAIYSAYMAFVREFVGGSIGRSSLGRWMRR